VRPWDKDDFSEESAAASVSNNIKAALMEVLVNIEYARVNYRRVSDYQNFPLGQQSEFFKGRPQAKLLYGSMIVRTSE